MICASRPTQSAAKRPHFQPELRSAASAHKQNRPPAEQMGGCVAVRFCGGTPPEAEPCYAWLRLGLAVRGRSRTGLVLCHELVELFLVLGVAQAIEEIAEFGLFLFQALERFDAVFVERTI